MRASDSSGLSESDSGSSGDNEEDHPLDVCLSQREAANANGSKMTSRPSPPSLPTSGQTAAAAPKITESRRIPVAGKTEAAAMSDDDFDAALLGAPSPSTFSDEEEEEDNGSSSSSSSSSSSDSGSDSDEDADSDHEESDSDDDDIPIPPPPRRLRPPIPQQQDKKQSLAADLLPSSLPIDPSTITTTTTMVPRKNIKPVGVTILQEGQQEQRNAQLHQLLRMPRYFDEDYEAAAKRCFKCGDAGHMARDCTNAPRLRPCFLCAEFGHDGRDCPNQLCWKCSRTGHQSRDCPYGNRKVKTWADDDDENGENGDEEAVPVCIRCGREDCACVCQGDYVRAEGGCTAPYRKRDLRQVCCFVCGQRGHLSCGVVSSTVDALRGGGGARGGGGGDVTKASCYNCGEGGHVGEACTRRGMLPAVRSERVNDRSNNGGGGGGGGGGGSYSAQRHYTSEQNYSSSRGGEGGGGYGREYRDGGTPWSGGSRGGGGYGDHRDGNYRATPSSSYRDRDRDRNYSQPSSYGRSDRGGGGEGGGRSSHQGGRRDERNTKYYTSGGGGDHRDDGDDRYERWQRQEGSRYGVLDDGDRYGGGGGGGGGRKQKQKHKEKKPAAVSGSKRDRRQQPSSERSRDGRKFDEGKRRRKS